MEQTQQSMKPKQYIQGETKQQRKARKRQEKAQKSVAVSPIPLQESVVNSHVPRYVCCLKYGDKYSADYVNKLYNMVKRNLTIDYEFVCFTEDAVGIDSNIRIEPLELINGVQGWWYKPLFFNPKISLKGTLLFLDLDIVIFDNIDKLFTYKPGEFCIIRDFNRHVVPNYNKFNSSIFRVETHIHQHSNVYNLFVDNPRVPIMKYHGDQDWLRVCITKDFHFWPENWIQSYKWEMRGKPKFNNNTRGKRDFAQQGEPVVQDGLSVAVFHGDPNPHNCKDPWVINNWR